MLLDGRAELVAERALHLVGRQAHRTRQADAGLDRDDEQVDELGQLVLDLARGASWLQRQT